MTKRRPQKSVIWKPSEESILKGRVIKLYKIQLTDQVR